MQEQGGGQQLAHRESAEADSVRVDEPAWEKRDTVEGLGWPSDEERDDKSLQGRRLRQGLSIREIVELVSKSATMALCVGSLAVLYSVMVDRARMVLRLGSEDALALWESTYPDPVLLPSGTTVQGRLKKIAGNTPVFYLCYILFYPLCLYFYLDREHYPKKAMGMAVLAYFFCFVAGYGIAGMNLFSMTNVVYAVLFVVVALKLTLPPDSKIPKLILYQLLGIQVLGTAFVMFGPPNFPMQHEGFRWVFYILIMPAFREFTRFLATQTAWYLRFDANVGGKGITSLHRECAHVFLTWVLIFWATYYRLLVANMESTEKSVAIVLYQAVLELLLRLTMFKRQRVIKRVILYLKHRLGLAGQTAGQNKERRGTKINPIHLTMVGRDSILMSAQLVAAEKSFEEQATREVALRDFISLVVLIDMMAEYIGIINSFVALAWSTDVPLARPYPWYIDNVLGKSTANHGLLIFSTVLQILMEVLVDGTCLYFERITDPLSIWRALNKRKFVPLLLLASWCGSTLANVIFINGENFSTCLGTDMCFCVNNGLSQGGVREAYCHLIYPNATWDTDPIILGIHVSNMSSISP